MVLFLLLECMFPNILRLVAVSSNPGCPLFTVRAASPPSNLGCSYPTSPPCTFIPVVRQQAVAEHEPAALVTLQVVGPLEEPALEAVQR